MKISKRLFMLEIKDIVDISDIPQRYICLLMVYDFTVCPIYCLWKIIKFHQKHTGYIETMMV